MDGVKEAFSKVKEDMDFLFEELNFLKEEFNQTKESLADLLAILKSIQESISLNQKKIENLEQEVPAHISLNPITPTHNPAHPAHFNGLKDQNLGISTGNVGVPTDRQTDRQTDIPTHKSSYNPVKEDSFQDVMEALNSLDSLKKEIRLKFKRLTDQEMLVFAMLYQLSEENGFTEYKVLSSKLNLTESSIRDYIGRLIKKGIPVEKTKINNKVIHLSVSPNLKKVVSLQTILQLREL